MAPTMRRPRRRWALERASVCEAESPSDCVDAVSTLMGLILLFQSHSWVWRRKLALFPSS